MANIAVDRLIVDIEARTKQFEAGLRRVEKQVNDSSRKMEKSFAGVNNQIASAGATLVKTFGVTVGIGMLSQLPRMMAASVSAIGDLSEAADKAGVSIRNLQRLQFAGIGSGLQLDDIVSNLAMFNKRIGEAVTKGGDLADLFKANNIPLKDQNGEIRDTIDLLGDVADLVKNARTEQERTVVATMALGKGGSALIPFLLQGGDAMRALMKAAEDAGFVIDEKMVKSADEFGDKWTSVAATFGKIWNATLAGIAIQMDSTFESVGALDDFLRKWTGKGLIDQPINDIIDPAGKAGREQAQRRADAEEHARQLEAGWRDRVTEREMLRQTPDLDELGQRRLKILDEEIERYERLIAAHKKFIDSLRVDGQPDVRPPPGTNRGGTVVPDKADEVAAKAKADAAHKQAIEEQNALLDRQKEILDDIQDRNEAIGEAAGAVTDGLRDVTMSAMDDVSSVGDSVLSMLKTIQKQLVDAFLFGGGPFAELFGTKGQNGAPGGIIGNAITGLVRRNSGGIGKGMPSPDFVSGIQPGLSAPGMAAKAGGAGSLTGIKAQVWDFFASKGLAPHQIAGIMGNIQGESGFNPLARNPSSGAVGLFQHLGSRKSGLMSAIGGDLSNVQGQLNFAWNELQGPESRAFRNLKASKDVTGATKAFAGFERAGGWSAGNPQGIEGWSQRIAAANSAMAQGGQKLANAVTTTASTATKAGGTFASQFPSGLQNVLSSLTSGTGGAGGGLGSLFKLFGFADGGYTGNGGRGRAAGIVHGREFVVNSDATAKYRSTLEAINGGGNPRLPSYAANPGSMSASRGMQVHYHDHAGVQITSKQSSGIDGDRIDVMVERKAEKVFAERLPRTMRDVYGLKPQLTNRF